MSFGFYAKFPPSMDVATAVDLMIDVSPVADGVDVNGARELLLARLFKQGLESVADLRLAFDSLKTKRDPEVFDLFELLTDQVLIESFATFLD